MVSSDDEIQVFLDWESDHVSNAEDSRDEIRRKYPGAARKADHEGNRAEAIKINCLLCMTGSRKEIRLCQDQKCVFWVRRPYADNRVRDEGVVPTNHQYRERANKIGRDDIGKARSKRKPKKPRKPSSGSQAKGKSTGS